MKGIKLKKEGRNHLMKRSPNKKRKLHHLMKPSLTSGEGLII